MFEPIAQPFVSPQFTIVTASAPWEREAAFALRRRVFCREQRLFAFDDRDEADTRATTIVALDEMMGMPAAVVGTVRIHEEEPGVWFGSRLAIERDFRFAYGIGSALVRRAVGTALERGCRAFFANVQRPNVALFRSLAWEALENRSVCGVPHVLMRAELAAYAADADTSRPIVVRARRAS